MVESELILFGIDYDNEDKPIAYIGLQEVSASQRKSRQG
jgi:hypothetical protein